MGNSNTEHSKNLRHITAVKWQRENGVKILISLSKGYHDLVTEFNNVPGNTKAQKLKLLINTFKSNPPEHESNTLDDEAEITEVGEIIADDWLSTSTKQVCNIDDEECESCQ